MTPSEKPDSTRVALELLQVAAARLRLGLLRSNELSPSAMAAMEEGLGGVAVCELAIERLPSLREHEALFIEVLRECGIEMPSTQQAVECLLRRYLTLVASGSLPPYEGLSKVVNELYRPYISDTPPTNFVGDQSGLEHLIGAFYSYDELRFRPDEISFEELRGDAALSALDRRVQDLAAAWLLGEFGEASSTGTTPDGM